MGYDPFLNELFQQEYPKLYRLAFHLLGDEEGAKDLVQETMLTALVHQEKLRGHPAPAGWLRVTLRNLLCNERRRAANRAALSLDQVPETLLGWERETPLEECLPRTLPEEDRQLFIWRFEDQMDDQLLADRLGITPSAARMRVFRAVRRCRAELEGTGNLY